MRLVRFAQDQDLTPSDSLTPPSGEYDFIVCGGYCPGVLEEKTTAVFPASKNLVTYVQPGSGHGINFAVR